MISTYFNLKGDLHMKKNVMFLIFTLIFCYVCVPSLSAQNGITASVTSDFDENDLPQAIPTHTFDFDVVLKVTDPSRDYDIKVVLTSSNFRGIAANAGDSLENDLYFDAEDNSGWKVSTDGTTLTYAYNSVNTTLPTSIKVRCRDNGAHGEIQLTIANTTIDITKHIPIDVNDNDIADGWERAHGFFVADVGDAQDKAEADDEKGPYDDNPDNDNNEDNNDNKHPGDGWSRHDEYRGIYTTIENGDPAGFKRLNPNKKDDADDDQSAAPTTPTTPTVTLVSSDGIYTATAGTGHEANLTLSAAPSYVFWYVQIPGATSPGTLAKQDNSGSLTSQLSYTFPSGVSGDYVISVSGTSASGGSAISASYTVTVSLPVSLPVWSDIPDPYNLTVGNSFSLDLNSYVTGSPTITKTGGAIPAGLSLSAGVISGTVTTARTRNMQFTATNSAGTAISEWVQVVVAPAPVVAPVWSDIPDPYNLTVGNSFTLDLNSYVTGSPTITKTGGAIPAGLSLSAGVISGTVTTARTRNMQFTATNSAGTAISEWIQISVAPEGS